MSQRYVKVEDAEVVESSNSTALTIFVISLIAIAVIAMAFWQPWASQPQSNSTTIIREKETRTPDSRPIIVNPPSTGAGDTNVTIHNEVPKTQDPPAKTDTGSDSNSGSSDNNNDSSNSEANNQ